MATKELLLAAPEPELALPAEPDYENLPTNILKTIVDNALRRSKDIGDSTDPEDIEDKTFSDEQALKVQAIIDARDAA